MEVSLKMCIKKITKKLNERNSMDIGLKKGVGRGYNIIIM